MEKEVTQNLDRYVVQLKSYPFSSQEWATVQEAKKTLHIDKPKFYHDAVVEYSRSILSDDS